MTTMQKKQSTQGAATAAVGMQGITGSATLKEIDLRYSQTSTSGGNDDDDDEATRRAQSAAPTLRVYLAI